MSWMTRIPHFWNLGQNWLTIMVPYREKGRRTCAATGIFLLLHWLWITLWFSLKIGWDGDFLDPDFVG